MAEYAKLAADKIQAAMVLVIDYFSIDRGDFVRRYFAGRKDVLEITTEPHTAASSPNSATLNSRPSSRRHSKATMVLAGPGAGKTRDRCTGSRGCCASMVPPASIMVLAYNRSAANELRRRLWALVGPDAAGVTVQTLHGLAMRLTGTSYAVALERGEVVDFGDPLGHPAAALHRGG
jgi:ATP-dependent DNA helicase RecQ